MSEKQNDDKAAKAIKAAILQNQYDAARTFRYMRTFFKEWKMLDSVGQPEKITENLFDNLELANSKT